MIRFMAVAGVFTVAIYFLWWLHNDHPFIAACVAGLMGSFVLWIIAGDFLVVRKRHEKLAEKHNLLVDHIEHRDAHVDAKYKELLKRFDEDEQRMDELEVPLDDNTPWG